MNFKEALLFSNISSACYNSEDKQHAIRIEETEEEYTPYLNFTGNKGPFFRTVWSITLHQIIDGKFDDSYKECKFYSLEACEEFLKHWGIPSENGWYIPKERI